MKELLLPTYGKGKEIADYLIKELGIPSTCTWFEVRIAVDETIKVTAQFHAEGQEIDE